MQACREFTKEKGWVSERVFRIPSKSEPGKYHIVELFSDGHLECDCVAGVFKRECSHKIAAKAMLRNKTLF